MDVKNLIKPSGRKTFLTVCTCMLLPMFVSCNGDKTENNGYDPGSAVVINDIYPTEGGYLDEVILRGENFGNDPKRIRVFFNQKEALVIGANKTRVLLNVPKLPGDECRIGMLLDGNTTDTVFCKTNFTYKSNYQLQYVCGNVGSTNTKFVEGAFSSTEFGKEMYHLAIDPNGILYLNHRAPSSDGSMCYIDPTESITKFLAYGDDQNRAGEPSAPFYDDVTKKVYFLSMRHGYYWEVDPNDGYTVTMRQLTSPSQDYIDNKGYHKYPYGDIMWCYSIARAKDAKGESWMYTRPYDGSLLRFKFDDRVYDYLGACTFGAADNYMCVDREDSTILYCALKQRNIITKIDLKKDITDPEFETLLCGVSGTGAFQDGHKAVARLNEPQQILPARDPATKEKILYICDSKNRCVRKYNMETEMMTTVAGIGGQSGYNVGDPTKSKMSWPTGICQSPDGDIYIVDNGNRVILKLIFV